MATLRNFESVAVTRRENVGPEESAEMSRWTKQVAKKQSFHLVCVRLVMHKTADGWRTSLPCLAPVEGAASVTNNGNQLAAGLLIFVRVALDVIGVRVRFPV